VLRTAERTKRLAEVGNSTSHQRKNGVFGTGDSGASSAFIEPQIKLHFGYIEGELNKWFAGEEFTAADIQMSFPSRWSP